MSGTGVLPAASFPVPPPLTKLPWATLGADGHLVFLTPPSISFLTELWAALQGGGGIIPSVIAISLPASGSVAAYNVVSVNGVGLVTAPDITNIADGLSIIGFATSSSPGGTSVSIQPTGLVTYSGWTWTPGGIIWCGAGGVPTQTATTGAGNWIRRVGVAISATEIMIGIGELVELT